MSFLRGTSLFSNWDFCWFLLILRLIFSSFFYYLYFLRNISLLKIKNMKSILLFNVHFFHFHWFSFLFLFQMFEFVKLTQDKMMEMMGSEKESPPSFTSMVLFHYFNLFTRRYHIAHTWNYQASSIIEQHGWWEMDLFGPPLCSFHCSILIAYCFPNTVS